MLNHTLDTNFYSKIVLNKMSQMFILFFDLWHKWPRSSLQNIAVRCWLVMTDNFEHKGKTTFKSRKLTNEWARIQDPLCKFIARGWKWNVHESMSNDNSDKLLQQPSLLKLSVPVRDLTMTNQMYDNMHTNENTLQYGWDFKIHTSNLQFPKLCNILWPL